jgi:hypothetical protein
MNSVKQKLKNGIKEHNGNQQEYVELKKLIEIKTNIFIGMVNEEIISSKK